MAGQTDRQAIAVEYGAFIGRGLHNNIDNNQAVLFWRTLLFIIIRDGAPTKVYKQAFHTYSIDAQYFSWPTKHSHRLKR